MQNIMAVIEDEHRTVIKIHHIIILQDSGVQIDIILQVVIKEVRESVIRTKEDTADKQRIMVEVNTSWLNHNNDDRQICFELEILVLPLVLLGYYCLG